MLRDTTAVMIRPLTYQCVGILSLQNHQCDNHNRLWFTNPNNKNYSVKELVFT